jgi:hypothetical protein
MEIYHVRSGDLEATVAAISHGAAVKRAIMEKNPNLLGTIITALRDGDTEDHEMIFSTEFIFKRDGLKVTTTRKN